MKEFKITEEQIRENKDLTLKEYFKEVFETKLEVGKWYKYSSGAMFFVENEIKSEGKIGFGFIGDGEMTYTDKFYYYKFNDYKLSLATEEEVFNALKKEAEKRYKVGQTVRCLNDEKSETINEIDYDFWFDYNRLWIHGDCKIFDNGKWAEIISQHEEVIELNGVKYKRID